MPLAVQLNGAMSESPDDKPFRFLDLPPEIRLKIYEAMIISPNELVSEDSRQNLSAQILRTCRLLHREAATILYEHNTFNVYHNGLKTVFRRFNGRNAENFRHLRMRIFDYRPARNFPMRPRSRWLVNSHEERYERELLRNADSLRVDVVTVRTFGLQLNPRDAIEREELVNYLKTIANDPGSRKARKLTATPPMQVHPRRPNNAVESYRIQLIDAQLTDREVLILPTTPLPRFDVVEEWSP